MTSKNQTVPGSVPYKLLVFLTAVLIVLRLLTLLTSIETVSHFEELHRGTLGKELLEGLKFSFWDYAADDYSGGSLVVGVLAAPFFYLLGPSLFALKLVPLGFSVAKFVLLWILIARFIGKRQAVLTGVLYLFTTPGYIRISLAAMGFHSESVLFAILMYFFIYQYKYEPTKRVVSAAGFGLCAGFGIWFCYTAIIAFAACLLSLLLLYREKPRASDAACFLVAFMAGFSPWFAYHFLHHFQGLSIFSDSLNVAWKDGGAYLQIIQNVVFLFTHILPRSFDFDTLFGLPGKFWNYAYYACVLLAVVPFCWKVRFGWKRPLLLPFFLYVFVFAAIYSVSNFQMYTTDLMGTRYFFPTRFFLLPLLASALLEVRFGRIITVLLLVMGVAGQRSLLFQEPLGLGLRMKGYSYFQLGEVMSGMWSFPHDAESYKKILRKFKTQDQPYVFWGTVSAMDTSTPDFEEKSRQLFETLPKGFQRIYVQEWASHWEKEWFPPANVPEWIAREDASAFSYGVASSLAWHRCNDEPSSSLHMNADTKAAERYYFYLGELIYDGYCGLSKINTPSDPLGALSMESRALWVYRGMGTGYAQDAYVKESPSKHRDDILREIPDAQLKEFYWGFGWGLRDAFKEDGLRAEMWEHRIPWKYRGAMRQGMRAWETWHIPELVSTLD